MIVLFFEIIALQPKLGDPIIKPSQSLKTIPIFKVTIVSMNLREQVRLGVSKRSDFPLRPEKTALLVVDVQMYCCEGGSEYYREESLPRMISNIESLLRRFRGLRDDVTESVGDGRRTGCEVIFTAIQALTNDGRDVSLDYKLSGPYFAGIPKVGAPLDEVFLPSIRPDFSRKGDVFLPKTASSVFHSTNIDYVLRNLNVEQLVVAGQITEQCVESTVRNAADMGYFVTVVTDACASTSKASHDQGLAGMRGYSRQKTTKQILEELS